MSNLSTDDLEAISDLLARYTASGDRGQTEQLAACFAPDGVLEFPGTRAVGPAAILSALNSGPRNPALTLVRHHLTTSQILPADPGTATGRTYFQVFSNVGPDHAGVYADRFVRLGTGWHFEHRQVRIDWQAAHSLFRKFDLRH
jgi:hypothetical protein